MITLLTLLCLSFVAYVYVVFPLLVYIRGILFPRSWKPLLCEPDVCFVIICHNEAADIRAKLKNICELDYPKERLSVVVASDGSTDGTDQIVQDFIAEYSNAGGNEENASKVNFTLLSYPRRGKIPTLNQAMSHAKGEIAVFSDANSALPRNVLRAMTRHFHDPSIGCVAGNQVYTADSNAGASAQGERTYWDFDRWLKISECRAGNAISATGSLYAIRRSLFSPVPSGVTDDFTISTRTILKGHRLIFDPEAIAFEAIAGRPKSEYKRKVRIMTRGFRGIWEVRELLNPYRFGFYSIQLISHKLLRRIVAVPLTLLLLLSPWMLKSGGILAILATGQYLFYCLAILGWIFSCTPIRRFPCFSIPLYFCLVNIAAMHAMFNFISGRKIEIWDSHRVQVQTVSVLSVQKD